MITLQDYFSMCEITAKTVLLTFVMGASILVVVVVVECLLSRLPERHNTHIQIRKTWHAFLKLPKRF